MKDNLLLLLSSFAHPQKNAVAATLAWMAEEAGWAFDCYYDAFRTGDHFGGGPLTAAEAGRAFGGTLAGHAHFEALYRLLALYECRIIRLGDSCFDAIAGDLNIPAAAPDDDPLGIYRAAAALFGGTLSDKLLVLGGAGEESYLYPLVGSERALAVHVSAPIAAGDLQRGNIRTVESALCSASQVEELRSRGVAISETHAEYAAGDMPKLSQSLARRWTDWCRGHFLGDPVVTSYFLPRLYRTRRLALYSEPLKPLINDTVLRKLGSDPVVYGRMFNDEDALELSRAGGCWQLVDPGRPPFPAAARPAAWHNPPGDLFELIDPGDDALRRHAENGDILTSIVFWSGCVREMENFYRLNDLVATSGFKCGYAVTSKTFAEGSQTPFGSIALPRERGGLFPLVEPLLASSGLGFSLERYLPDGAFSRHFESAMREIAAIVPPRLRPRGWWACLDTRLEPEPNPPAAVRGRPFGHFRAGEPDDTLYPTVARHGFEYAVSKAAHDSAAAAAARPIHLVRQHAGSWQGWSPFHAISGVEDIKQAEKRRRLGGGPGYIVGTLDTCLWAFSLPLWERGRELKTAIDFILHGGRSGRLVNVHPYAVYRYAKFLREHGIGAGESADARLAGRLRWLSLRSRHGMRALLRRVRTGQR